MQLILMSIVNMKNIEEYMNLSWKQRLIWLWRNIVIMYIYGIF